MSGARRQTDPRRLGAKKIHVVQDPLEPVLGDMFGRLSLLVTIAESGNQEVICYHFHSVHTLHKLVHSALSHFRRCEDAKRHHAPWNRSNGVLNVVL